MKPWLRKLTVLIFILLWSGIILADSFCVKCGKKLEDDVKFCPQCGHKVGAPLEKKEEPEKPKEVVTPIPEYDNIEEANQYYDLAETERKSVGALILPNLKAQRYRKALSLYSKILEKWPNSTKCEMSAYRIAEIYESIAFRDWQAAIRYYRMVLAINPETTLDARFQIARITENGINDYEEAMVLYKDCVENARVQKEKEKATKAMKKLEEKIKKSEEKLEPKS
ncbi:MAG: zinc-ribbon domain-containing protein [Planctomycetes bacterium]|nr:zinc-ribbon domain-containing protein [Planctomycetota bacterium]